MSTGGAARGRLAVAGVVTVVIALLAPLVASASLVPRGARFQQRASFPPILGALGAVTCTASRVCLAVGEEASTNGFFGSGIVLRSTDDGHTWRPEPLPPGTGPLDGVTCPTATHCLATVGFTLASGAVIATVDGGRHWHPETSGGLGGSFGLQAIQCSTSQDCAVGGDSLFGGLLATTTDGGADWADVSPFSAETETSVNGVWCQAATVCEAVGVTYDQNGNASAAAARTIDGGVTWTPQTMPTGVNELDALSCASATTCEAVAQTGSGPEMVGTTDGGATWTAQRLPARAGADSVTCMSATQCVASGFDGNRAAVLETADGGSTWTVLRAAGVARALYDATCSSASRCVLVGVSQRRAPLVVHLADGRVGVQALADARGILQVASISCVTSTRCAAVGSIATGRTDEALSLSTADGGHRWSTGRPLPASVAGTEVECPSATACVALGESRTFGGLLLYSHGVGAVWHVGLHTMLPLLSVSCSTATHCVAGGVRVLFESTDGGRSWQNVRPKGADWVVSNVACTTGDVCVATAFSRSGKLLLARSTDGGAHWSLVKSSASVSIDALTCTSARLCIATGGSMNGVGIIFIALARALGPRLFPGVRHLDRLAAAASGGDGAVVLVSRDGGAHWRPAIVPPTATELPSVSCLSATDCLAVGVDEASPMLLRSTNEGQTWRFEGAPRSTTSLSSVFCGAGTCFVEGTTAVGTTVLAAGQP